MMGDENMDNAQFKIIVEKYANTIYRTTLSFCNNISDAEDAVQNAFIKLMKCDIDFQDDNHIKKWLTKVAINECKMLWRSYWYKNIISIDDVINEPSHIDNERQELFDELMKLPVKYRSVLHLYYYEGYHCNEIAEILNISPSTVHTQLHRARNMLKEQIKEA